MNTTMAAVNTAKEGQQVPRGKSIPRETISKTLKVAHQDNEVLTESVRLKKLECD